MPRPLRPILLSLLLGIFSCSPTNSHPGVSHKVAARASLPVQGRVVIVHGIFDTRIGLSFLRDAIAAEGYECLMPSLRPVDGRKGLELMARQLREIIDQKWGPDGEFSIVAFSMGGLISRYYLQELDGAVRCRGLHTVATPHNGTYVAYLYPGLGARQMRPNSAFLAKLQGSEQVYDDLKIPTTSYRSPLDVVMMPLESPNWHRGDNIHFWSPIHPALLWNRTLHRDLLGRLEQGKGR